ncbi:MAG: hypothetical protein LBF66_03355 [Holosporales bacterium]|nr:hypothetical protein [Holosporales bacterium]
MATLVNIHIPSDAPGFLRDQSLVTSGLVPRSVSREPYRLGLPEKERDVYSVGAE